MKAIGDKAPDFELPDRAGEQFRLSDLIGKKSIVLYFYPSDFTPGCTKEACSFRDNYESFKDAGAEVIGISADPPERHNSFIIEYKLPFILLSDEDGKVRTHYGVSNTLGLIPGRVTFVIDRKGIIRHIFNSQLNPKKHITEALRILKDLP